ncbi:MAG: glycosyltransferase [Candidatus Saccharibacteria bacterium]|nr:glycosyltransferase [Candidatus Saccharibacteria bacterium]
MRIAVFTDLYLEVTGGIPSSVRAQKQALTAAGHKVVVFCPKSKQTKLEEVGVVAVPTMSWKLAGAPMPKRPKVIKKFVIEKFPRFGEDFDLVHVHYEGSCSIAGVELARKYGLPVVQTMHGREDIAVAYNVPLLFKTMVAGILEKLHGRKLKHEVQVKPDNYLATTKARARMWTLMVGQANAADVVITPSAHFAEKIKHYGVRTRIEVVSNGVPDEVIEMYDWPVRRLETNEDLRLIWSSRLSQEKRIMPFLEAIKELRAEKIKVTLIGDGNQLGRAKRYVARHGLKRKVRFLGAVSHRRVLKELIDQDVMVMNSYGFDTQGLTMLEAEACGLPVIYADPDMRKILPDKGGVWTGGPEVWRMVDTIKKLMDKPELVTEMSQEMLNRRKEVLQSTQLLKLLAVYEGVIKN